MPICLRCLIDSGLENSSNVVTTTAADSVCYGFFKDMVSDFLTTSD